MILHKAASRKPNVSAPRAGGDDPENKEDAIVMMQCSPRGRG